MTQSHSPLTSRSAIPFDALTGFFPPLFTDYISPESDRSQRASSLFGTSFRSFSDLLEKAETLMSREYARERLVRLLERQNVRYGAGSQTLQNIHRLRSNDTLAVVTGQQVGLFTGSIYTIYKTLSTIYLSTLLTQRLKEAFPTLTLVPIFWLETEDHDFQEAAQVSLVKDHQLHSLPFHSPTYTDRDIVGRHVFTDAIDAFRDRFIDSLQESDFKAEIDRVLRQYYTKGETMSSSFAHIMMHLFKDDGLVLLNPDDDEVKRLIAPVFQKELSTAPAGSYSVIEHSAGIEEKGYDVQAKAHPINLYLIENNRRLRLSPQSENEYALLPDKSSIRKSQIEEYLSSEPWRFSTNVILRPIAQDTLLPTLIYVAGPGEVAYWAQLTSLYRFFSLPMPLIFPRLSATVLEPKFLKQFERTGMPLEQAFRLFLNDRTGFKEYALPNARINTIKSAIEDSRLQLSETMKTLELVFNSNGLSSPIPFSTLSEKVVYPIKQLQEKMLRQEEEKFSAIVGQIDRLYKQLLPEEKLQERQINLFYFINKYGFDFLQTMKASTKEFYDTIAHQIIIPPIGKP